MYRHTQPSQHVDSRLSDHTLRTYIELKFIEWQHAHLTRLAVVTQCRVAPDNLTYVFCTRHVHTRVSGHSGRQTVSCPEPLRLQTALLLPCTLWTCCTTPASTIDHERRKAMQVQSISVLLDVRGVTYCRWIYMYTK